MPRPAPDNAMTVYPLIQVDVSKRCKHRHRILLTRSSADVDDQLAAFFAIIEGIIEEVGIASFAQRIALLIPMPPMPQHNYRRTVGIAMEAIRDHAA